MSNAKDLAKLVLDWWEDNQYEFNAAYLPDFVVKAKEIVAEVQKHQ